MPSRRNRTVSLPLSIGAGKWTQKQFKRGQKGGGRVAAAPPPPQPTQPVISVLPMIVVPMSNNNNNHNFACEPISPKVVKSNCHNLETKAAEVQKDDVVKEKEQAKEGLSFQRFLSRKSSSDQIVGKESKEGKAAEKVEKKVAVVATPAPAAVPLPIPTTQKDGVKEVVSTLDEPRRLTADRYVMGASFIIKSDEHLIEKILMKMNSWHPEDASKQKTRMYKESDMKIIIKEITLRVDKINSIFYMPLMCEILERVSNLVRRKFGQNGVLLLAMDLFKALVEVGYGPNIPSSIEYLCAHHLDSMMLTMIKEDGSLTQESKRKKLIEHQAKKDKARFSVTPAVTTPNNSVATVSTTTTNATMVVMAV